jgi:cobalt/nickel transport system permease protein
MHINRFDRYEERHSLVHLLDPRVKVVVTVLFIVANVLLPDGAWPGFLASWGLVLLVGWLARLPAVYSFKRAFIVLPFTLAAVTVLFTLPGEALVSWQMGSQTVAISDAGLVRFVSIVIRSWLSVQMAILLTATTQFPDLMHALTHLRMPAILVSIIAFMYRYLFVLADEAMRLLRAREARSARLTARQGGGSMGWRAKVTGHMVGQLLVRSLDRSDHVYNAMLARGYDGRLLTLNPHQMKGRDWLWGTSGAVLIGLIQVIGRMY